MSARRSNALDTLEHLSLYGVILPEYHRAEDGTYSYTLAGTGYVKTRQTAAQVKAFSSGAMAVMRALNEGQMKVHHSQFIPGRYNYGYSLSDLTTLAARHLEVPLETQS